MASRPSKRRRISPTSADDANISGEIMETNGASKTASSVSKASSAISAPSAAEDNKSKAVNQENSAADVEPDDESNQSESGSGSEDEEIEQPSPSTAQRPVHTPRTNVSQAANSSKASVMRMQIDEMLRQVKPAHGKKEAAAEDILRRLKTVIETLPQQEPLSVQEAEKKLLKSHKIATPFPLPRPVASAQYKLAFQKPSSINVIGSHIMKTGLRVDGKLSIDLVVNMPTSLFSPKDYLDYRYFHKRAYYIACIAAGVRASSNLNVKLSFSCLHGNSLLPVILVQPLDNDVDSAFALSRCDIYILPAMAEDFFPRGKTVPDRSCIRSQLPESEAVQEESKATPFYNASVRTDCSVISYLKLLHGAGAKCAGFREACLLGRIWLRQRGFGTSVYKGGFGHFEWAALVALLLQGGGPQGKPVLLSSYDGYQLFRATIQFLALKNLAKQPLVIEEASSDSDTTNETPLFEPGTSSSSTGNTVPMCYDRSRGLNILYKMLPWSYISLRKEAQGAVKMLTSLPDPFESLFILRVGEPLIQYDLLGHLGLKQEHGSSQNILESATQLKKIYDDVTRGLGNRVKLVNIMSPTEQPWSINTSRPHQRDPHCVIALVLDPEHAPRTVDRGPSAEDPEAAASFREFWGDKAELRRFKDGQILECVAWEHSDPLSLTKEIIQFLMKHNGVDASDSLTFLGNDFSSAPVALRGLDSIGDASEQLLTAFRSMENQIRSLEGLPLQVRHIQPARPWLRNHSSGINVSSKGQGIIPTDVMIQFEGSGRWPDDLGAIAMTKIAFLLKLDELLSEKAGNVTTKLGLENEHSEILNSSYLDVVYPAGAAFRLRIHHEREQTLIERQLGDKSASPKAREEAAVALAEYKKNFVRKPLHTQAMQTLVTRFRALTPTVLAVKTWFDSHLIGNHFSEELIEIIVARAFLQPHPWQTPSSAMTGFLRVLHFMAYWDWQNDPLIVDFSGSMKKNEIGAIQTRFEAWRKIDPSRNRVVLFAATNYDTEGTTWTEYHPAKVVAGRMTSLAKAACGALRDKGTDLNLGTLFKSPLKGFDFVIRLNPRFTTSGRSDTAQSKYKNLQAPTSNTELVGYNVVKLYVDELQSLYGDSIVLFSDGVGQGAIAGLWSPHTGNRKWKVNLPYSTYPASGTSVQEDVDAVINKGAILSEMARLGGDIVSSVEPNR